MPTVSSIVSHKKRLTGRCKGRGQRQSNWPIRALRGVFSVTRWSELARQGMANADTQAAMREFFGVDAARVVRAALASLSAHSV